MSWNLIDFPPWRKSRGPLEDVPLLAQDLVLASQPLQLSRPPGDPGADGRSHARAGDRASAAGSTGRSRDTRRPRVGFDRWSQPAGPLHPGIPAESVGGIGAWSTSWVMKVLSIALRQVQTCSSRTSRPSARTRNGTQT